MSNSSYLNIKWRQAQTCNSDYPQLREKLSALAEEAYRLENTPGSDESRLTEINNQIGCYGEVYQKAIEEIFNNPQSAENEIRKYHPNLENLQAFQANLQSLGTPQSPVVIIYTLVAGSQYWVMLITPKTIIAESRPLKSTEIDAKVQRFRAALQDTSVNPQPLATELYNDLLSPIANDLERLKPKTLVWSLDRELRYLPLAALHDGKNYLVEKYNQVLYTAASPSRWESSLPRQQIGAGFGVSNGIRPLPAVTIELAAIFGAKDKPGILAGDTYSNEAFTKDALGRVVSKARANDYLSLHIASHFTLQTGAENFLNSYLLLGNNERLTIGDMDARFNVFNRVHLLVLSACNTAVAVDGKKLFGNGVEVESFGALAQEKGAKAVLATLWEVNDSSTSELMQKFYGLWLKGKTNSKVEALRQAQLALLNGDTRTNEKGRRRGTEIVRLTNGGDLPLFKRDPAAPLAHPYYWSPFVLIGNWK